MLNALLPQQLLGHFFLALPPALGFTYGGTLFSTLISVMKMS